MPVYRIAGLNVFMEPRCKLLEGRAKQYRLTDNSIKKADCEIIIDPQAQGFEEWLSSYRNYPMDSNEYTWFGYRFYCELIHYGGFFLHASAVSLDNRAYLFSADSGTGKSTHTGLWLDYFGKERAFLINDDKPALLKGENSYLACGTPFSGKHDLSRNAMVPVQALCFLERAAENSIRKIESSEAVRRIFTQIMRSADRAVMEEILAMLDGFLSSVPAYVLRCSISEDAVKTAYRGMVPSLQSKT